MISLLFLSLLPSFQLSWLGTPVEDQKNIIKTKLAIVGGGPCGLSAAIGAAKSGWQPVVIEGSITNGAANRAGLVSNYPGLDNLTGPEIVQRLKKQAQDLGAQLYAEESVVSCNFNERPFTLETNKNNKIVCDAVIIATGTNPKKLGLPGEAKFEGKGVAYCSACDGPLFKDKEVIIVGDDYNALRELATLKNIASKITIVTHKNDFQAPGFLLDNLKNSNVSVIKNAKVKEIMGTNKVTGVKAVTDEGEVEVPAQGVFIALGWQPCVDAFKNCLKLNSDNQIKIDGDTLETSVSGVFAAGDCSSRSYHQMPSATGFGYTAYLNAEKYLRQLEAQGS